MLKYPTYIVNSLLGHEDYFLSQPDSSELDGHGCFSKEACDTTDKLILSLISKEIAGYVAPKNPAQGTDPNNKWRTISSMQKAIRFGLADDAEFAASAGYDMDKAYVMKRLGVIAVEDCLLGNPRGTLAALAIMGNAAWRRSVDERRLFMWLSRLLASGYKDRTAVNLLVWAGVETDVPKTEWAKAPLSALKEGMSHPGFTLGQRMCAAWTLAGTKRYEGPGFPTSNDRSPVDLYAYMVERGLPRMMLYIAAKTASRLSEAMFATMPIIHDMVLAWGGQNATLISSEVYPQKVGLLLGAAYDKHTREGKIAIKRWFGAQKELSPFMQATPVEQRQAMQGTGVFLAEGGVLDRRIFYGPDYDRVTERVKGPERFSFMGPELAGTYLDVIRQHLPELNQVRLDVLKAKQWGQ